MRAAVSALLIVWLAATPARGQPQAVSEKPESVALTIYPDPQGGDITDYDTFDAETGLALVTEWRTIEVPAGETVLRFRGVAEGIVPQTAALEGLPARPIEQNQDYDLLSPGSLVARAIGEPVKRVRTNRETGQETVEDAVVRSGPNGVVLEIDGRFEAFGCGGGPERIVFERAPEGLTDRPTLSMRVRVKTAGRYQVKLTYLAVGLLWSANYVASVRDDGRLDLLGWITLKNLSGTTFAQAPTQFVAGELESSGETSATEATALTRPPNCWPMDTTTHGRPAPPPPPPPPAPPAFAGSVEEIVVTANRRQGFTQDVPVAVMAVQSELGDYKLYSLPGPTTVAARQTKQVAMLSRDGVSFDRVYGFMVGDGDTWEPDQLLSAGLLLRTKNSKAKGLGLPLPGGKVAVMQTNPDGRRMLASETSFRNTPVDAPLELNIGEAPGIEIRPRQVRAWKRGKRDLTEYEVAVTNTREDAIAFEVVHYGDAGLKVRDETQKHARKPAGLTWALTLAPGERQVLRYTIETR